VLLVTGFGPFAEIERNPSGDAAECFDGTTVAGVWVVGRRLDVSWERAFPALLVAVEEVRPCGLLCLGVGPHPFLRLEVIAKNAALSGKDVDDAVPLLGPRLELVTDAPPAYFTTLPVEWLEARLAEGSPTEPDAESPVALRWSDAGSYLCNALFYRAMHELEGRVPVRGFVHVPPYPEEAEVEGNSDPTDHLRVVWDLVAALAEWLTRSDVLSA